MLDQLTDQMDAETAGSALFDRSAYIRLRRRYGVELMPIVFEHEAERPGMNLQSQQDLVDGGVIVAVLEDIGRHFFNGQMGKINRPITDPASLDEPHCVFRDAAEVIGSVVETSLKHIAWLGAHQNQRFSRPGCKCRV
jgi:hypothetical protein